MNTYSDLIAYLVSDYGLKEGEVSPGADYTLYNSEATCNLVFDQDEYGDVVHWDTSTGHDGTINLGDTVTLLELKNLTNALN